MLLNFIQKNLTQELTHLKVQALVLFSYASKKEKASLSQNSFNTVLKAALEDGSISGKQLEVFSAREINYHGIRHLIVIGLGESWDHEIVRQAVSCGYEAAKNLKAHEIVFDFDGLKPNKEQGSSFAKACSEGVKLSSYSFDHLKSKSKDEKNKKSEKTQIHFFSTNAQDKKISALFEEGLLISECVNFSKYLGDMPGNLMTPAILADKAVEAAKGTKIKVTVWDRARIKKERMGGLLGVSLGSSQEPRFIIMEYSGAGKKDKPFVLVGKGLTFDSGGISIKPSASMEEMKYDMCGGANVIGAILAIEKLKLKLNVVALIPATENMPGPSANKPGDVCVARNGKSFEVNNTDAEGRLILSDALSYACELKPQCIFDAATLTGAIVVALGNTHTGYFTRNKELKSKIEFAAEKSGEWVWNMPLCDHHLKDIKGTYADISNISHFKGAGSATAAAFLEQFVEDGIPWAHFDIAGTAWAVGNRLSYCSKKGASGAMIRTFVELAKQYAKQ